MSDRRGWVGFDLDGTLAYYDRWRGELHIGAPIRRSLAILKEILEENVNDVRIFTARASAEGEELAAVVAAIDAWCLKYVGRTLPVTCRKDYQMVCLYDDRCKQVIPNTGELVEDLMLDYKPFYDAYCK